MIWLVVVILVVAGAAALVALLYATAGERDRER